MKFNGPLARGRWRRCLLPRLARYVRLRTRRIRLHRVYSKAQQRIAPSRDPGRRCLTHRATGSSSAAMSSLAAIKRPRTPGPRQFRAAHADRPSSEGALASWAPRDRAGCRPLGLLRSPQWAQTEIQSAVYLRCRFSRIDCRSPSKCLRSLGGNWRLSSARPLCPDRKSVV